MAVRRVLSVAGNATEIFELHAEPALGTALLQILVIPGNPGSAAYYLPFLQSLHTAYQGRAAVSAVSQLGHAVGESSRLFSLSDQIQHKVDFLEAQVLSLGRLPVVIMGHSIGAYMALHAVKALEESNKERQPQILKVVALFPFLSVDATSLRQRTLRAVTRLPILCGTLFAVLGLLPAFVKRRLVQLASGGMDAQAVEATVGLIRGQSGRNIAFLARCEFRDLRPPPDWSLIMRLGERFLVCLAEKDTWMPVHQGEELKRRIPPHQVIEDKHFTHGFCCSERQSQLLVRRVLPNLPEVG